MWAIDEQRNIGFYGKDNKFVPKYRYDTVFGPEADNPQVRMGNGRAIQVYEAHGFHRVSQRKNYYPSAHGQCEDALVMSLRL